MSGDKSRMWTKEYKPVTCHEEVVRRGEYAPCEKPAVGYAMDDDRSFYPVCNEHLVKNQGMQP